MTNGFQLVYGDPSQVIQPNPTMYTQAPLYYQMPMQSYAAPGLEVNQKSGKNWSKFHILGVHFQAVLPKLKLFDKCFQKYTNPI